MRNFIEMSILFPLQQLILIIVSQHSEVCCQSSSFNCIEIIRFPKRIFLSEFYHDCFSWFCQFLDTFSIETSIFCCRIENCLHRWSLTSHNFQNDCYVNVSNFRIRRVKFKKSYRFYKLSSYQKKCFLLEQGRQ